MPPQQGQMLPPVSQQMPPQGQGGAQLPPEVMQILMSLPENIRQYLLSLPPEQMIMELQKIMQEQMAQQQGAPVPPQGGEQVAPPMMGKYGMKIRAKMGLKTFDPKVDLGKIEDSSDIRLAQKKINPYLITKPKTTTTTITPSEQPAINPNTSKLGQKVMLNGKAATIDMVDGKLVFKYDDGSGIQEVKIAQTTPTLPQGAVKVGNIDNNTAVVNDNQVQSRNLTKTSSSGVTNSIVPKSKVVITKPAQTNNSPTAGQQVTTNPVTKPKKVTTSPNNTQWTDKELKDEFMQGKILDPITITPKGNYRGVTEPTVQNQGRSSSGPSIDNSSYIKHVNRVSEIDRQIKKLESNKYSYNNEFKISQLKAEKRHWEDIIKKAKRDTLRKSTNNTYGVEIINNRGYSNMIYKSGGQLPSALKITTNPKTIIDKKVEMFKSGGKIKLKTCKHGC